MNQPAPKTQPDGLVGTTAIVTGASRGFGRAIATALCGAGAHVVGVARTRALLEDVRDQLGDTFTAVVADAADPATASRLHRRAPAAHAGAVRRGRAPDESAAGSDLGDLQRRTGTSTSHRRFTGSAMRCSARSRRAAR